MAAQAQYFCKAGLGRGEDPTMSRRRTLVLLMILSGMFASSLYAQSPQSSAKVLEGQIRDSSGAALAGAEVSLITAGGQILSKTTSDGGGRFAFPSVELGQYLLRAKAEGFDVGETPIEFAATSTDHTSELQSL